MSGEVYTTLTFIPMALAGIAFLIAFLRYSKMGGDLKLLGISIAVSALIAGAVLYYLAAVSDKFASEVLFVFALVVAGASAILGWFFTSAGRTWSLALAIAASTMLGSALGASLKLSQAYGSTPTPETVGPELSVWFVVIPAIVFWVPLASFFAAAIAALWRDSREKSTVAEGSV